MTLDELFRHSLVINLDTAEDRLALMRRAFSLAGLPMPRRIGAIRLRRLQYNDWWRRPPGSRYHMANCSASHVMCVQVAKALGWPFVFVFEDDAWPCRGAARELEAAADRLEPTGCWFPGWASRDDLAGPGRDRFVGAHAYVVFADAYDTLLAAYQADLPRYYPDNLFQIHQPLRGIARLTDRCIFTQMNLDAQGAPMYCGLRPAGAREIRGMWWAFTRTVPEGFPSYEEVALG